MENANQTGVPSFKTTLGNYVEVIPYFQDEYRFLSNFWLVPVVYDGETYPSAEHAYQAAKFTDQDFKKLFREHVTTPQWAKHVGRHASIGRREDFENVKEQIMLEIVRSKFHFSNEMRYKLGQTGYKTLVEGNHWHDVYWGVCDGGCSKQHKGVAMGYNVLGRILEKVRAENRDEYFEGVLKNANL